MHPFGDGQHPLHQAYSLFPLGACDHALELLPYVGTQFTVVDENVHVGLGSPVGFLMSDTCLQNHRWAECSGRFFQTLLGPNWLSKIAKARGAS